MKKHVNKIYYILIGLLFGLSCFLMLYRLGDIPNGIHVDEAGSFYDAICLVKYGVDRYLYHNPVYFINFGGGQNALYTYLATISFRLFGASLWSFRLVSVIISLVSYYCFFKLVRRYKSRLFSVLVLFLLTILPVYIMKSRWGLESFLLNPMLIISLYFYIRAIDKGSILSYVIAGVLFGISFYTYAVSYLIIPIFLVSSIIYLFIKRKISIKNIIALLVPVVVFGIPLLLMLMINKGVIESEIITKVISVPKMWFYRGGEISITNIKYIIDDLKYIFIGNGLVYNSIPKFGTLYIISIPFVVCGFIYLIYKIIKKKCDLLDVLMFILFIVVFGVCLCVYDINVNKANAIYICFVYFIVLFLEWLYNRKFRGFLVISLVLYSLCFIIFSLYYFKDYSLEYDKLIYFENDELFEAIDYAESIRGDNGKIYLGVLQGYIYPLLHFDIDPYVFNDKAVILKDDKIILSYDYYIYYLLRFNDLYNHDYVYILENSDPRIKYYDKRGFIKKEFGSYSLFYYED